MFREIGCFRRAGFEQRSANYVGVRQFDKPFTAMEKIFNASLTKPNKCENSRDFVMRVLPDIAYIASLPELVRRASEVIDESWLTLERLSGCVRDGLDSLEKLAL